MNRAFVILLTFLITTHAFAVTTQVPFIGKTLNLVGRGLSDKNSNASFALACVDSSCSVLNFVYFSEDKTAYWIGEKIIAPTAPTKKLQKEALSLLIQEYFWTHHTKGSASAIDRRMIRSGEFLLVGTVVSYLTFGVGLIPMAAIGAGAVASGYLLTSTGAMDLVIKGHSSSVEITDQGNWNWSVDPKEISTNQFQSLVSRINTGVGLIETGVYGSWEREDSFARKTFRKKHRFEKKGAHFAYNTWQFK